MKRIICLITALCLILGSFSFCFAANATWSTTDQQNLSNAASRLSTIISTLQTTNSTLNTISNRVLDISNALFDDNHSVAYWTSAISSWMSPIYNSITAIPVDISTIIGALGYFTDNGTTYHPYLNELNNALSNAFNQRSDGTGTDARNMAHSSLFVGGDVSTFTYPVHFLGLNGLKTTYNQKWGNGTPLGNIMLLLRYTNESNINSFTLTKQMAYTDYNAQQTGLSWTDIEQSITFTPTSSTNGLYNWLKNIQAPVARLSYVLASDERIAAQEAAAANEEAVVDNFIDNTGDGSASPSDIGSISDLSSGYKSNFGSDASVSGIFNIFNSNNMGWFSQETANQLDTTTRTRRGSSFDTPLLDQQIRDIYDQIGVVND